MNLFVRSLTGAVFAAVLVSAILGGAGWSAALFCLLSALAAAELVKRVNEGKGTTASPMLAAVNAAAANLSAVSLYLAAEGAGTGMCTAKSCLVPPMLLGALFFVIFLREIYGKKATALMNTALTLMPVTYIAVPFALITLTGLEAGKAGGAVYNGLMPLAVFLFIWSNDVGAYLTGCTLGRHRLFERISPKKSWEGSIGGALLTVGVSVLLPLAMPQRFGFLGVWTWVAIAAVTVVAGTYGDLAESLMKRELGIKDSGNALPGHGGWLDRFDSTLFAFPAVTVLLCVRALLL
ncbi:MAG: phosphatidate cytidylyltransferase [Bacteroidales bacterium]|nr:phosphatidate cytidylyltransferase [Bacteroidales bacterium]